MFCVGLTGSIASGKSTVSQFFKNQGIEVISADEAARELTAINQPALAAIENYFGKSVISLSGELKRGVLREAIFNNPEKRLWLEGLLHPLIKQYIKNKIKEASGPYVLIEIPLLYNRADYPYLDRILVVIATHEQQIERVMNRDQCSRKQAETILAVQHNEQNSQKIADDLIRNDGTLAKLAKKIENLHCKYLQLASQ